ncbi:MAG: HEAT repeat domain-containing protein [Planctomycetota bacterium]
MTPSVPPGLPWLDPGSGGGIAAPDPGHWGNWWFYNRDHFLDFAGRFARRDAVSADGEKPTLGANATQVAGEIIPALHSVLNEGGSIALVRESLLALARLRSPDARLIDYALLRLADGSPEVKEAAALALAIHGDTDAMTPLLDLALDTEQGRELAGEEYSISPRLRAMAVYGIGLLGKENPYDRLPLADAILDVLGSETITVETQVACVLTLGQLTIPFCDDVPEEAHGMFEVSGRHLCGGILANYLVATLDDEELDPWLHAHAAATLGRVATQAPESFRVLAAEKLLELGDPRSDSPSTVRNGAVIGLGLLADADHEEIDRSVREGLRNIAGRGDDLSRRLATIALAEVGAREGAGDDEDETAEETGGWLLRLLSKGKAYQKRWAALGLAVFGHHRAAARAEIPMGLAAGLREVHGKTRHDQEAAPFVLALGLLGDVRSEEEILARFERSEDLTYRAHAALSLGLLTTRSAKEPLLAAFAEEQPTPDLAIALAVGLRLLGHREVVPALIERAEEAEDPAARAAWVAGLGALFDGDAVTPLAELVADADAPATVRAAAARSLGAIGDPQTILWNAVYANDVTYTALTWTLRDPLGEGLGVLDQR